MRKYADISQIFLMSQTLIPVANIGSILLPVATKRWDAPTDQISYLLLQVCDGYLKKRRFG